MIPHGEVIGDEWDSVAISADANTLLVEGLTRNRMDDEIWAAWIFKREGSKWVQQATLIPRGQTNLVLVSQSNASVALSARGDTAIVGVAGDRGGVGGAWVFDRVGSRWRQQARLPGGSSANGLGAEFGFSVALSADGGTALVGGPQGGPSSTGLAWVFTRSGSTWRQQGAPLHERGGTLNGFDEDTNDTLDESGFGTSVSLDGSGDTALIGDANAYGGAGAAYVFTRSGRLWAPAHGLFDQYNSFDFLGPTLQYFGDAVVLSADGNSALVERGSSEGPGACRAYLFTRAGASWVQMRTPLVAGKIPCHLLSVNLALSGDGRTAVVTGPIGHTDSPPQAAWIFTKNGSTWTHAGVRVERRGQLAGLESIAVALPADGRTVVVAGDFGTRGRGSAYGSKNTLGTVWVSPTP